MSQEIPARSGTVTDIRFEHVCDALGIGTGCPRLSWTTLTGAPDWLQTGYEIELTVPAGADAAGGRPVTVQVASADSVLVPWPFEPLGARDSGSVRVRVTGSDGRVTPWSEPATAEVGLLAPDDWSAVFVTPDWDEDAQCDQPSPMLRHEFQLSGPVRSARLYATALGVYEAEINGSRVGDQLLAPGWTAYDKRLRYQTYDVTALLKPGRNALGAILGDGWFRGRIGFDGKTRALYGDRLAFLAQLEVAYADGTTERITTDTSWQAATGPIVSSSLYDGEAYDARLERAGWTEPGHDTSGWRGVRVLERDLAPLVAPAGPPVRRTEELAPVSVTVSPSGRTVLDFGQNLVGWLRVSVSGEAGTSITLRHAEVLEEGELCTRPLRTAAATDTYTLRGEGTEVFEPRFTFHGFRYAEITGQPDDFDAATAVRAVVVHSDLNRTGHFSSSDELVNRLHENVVWGMRGNFLDLPTDCPQRDERLGWTGDIQVFSPTASYLYDSAGFLTSWLADLAAEQGENGLVPFVVPKAGVTGADTPTAAWGDAAVVVPWVLYERYGDTGILDAQYDSMRAWVEHEASLAGENRLWDSGFQFGDWLDPTAPAGRPDAAATAGELVATAHFARSADILARTAAILGKTEDAERYRALADEVRAAFQAEYVTGAGRMMCDAPTAYALALRFGLLDSEAQRARAGERLAQLARAGGHKIATGFVGTPLICDALADTGHIDTAYRLLLQQECPSWLYPVTMGATTIWERWDSLLPDGTVNPSGMTSFNHYALGAVADWLHRTVAGLAPAEPGYRRLRIAPRPGGDLTHAEARLRTPYGEAEVSWSLADGELTVNALVPPNTTAEVALPGTDAVTEVGSGRHTWTVPFGTETAELAPLSVDMTVDELLAREEAARVFKALLISYVPEAAAFIEDGAGGAPTGISIRTIAGMLPNGDSFLSDLEEKFAALEAASGA
ncbi:glycoside hydrolase family 78 protein [Streptomyces sp. AS02]|uniref:glycoside hydrolase family 78 protein n=1 Tax=Streptomyces sp. AS02 TaxID=2938946 RepID=UPI00202221AA|nr:glycoside hydrolase family 78 protein [Streptomyces sp. AS02]MCL8014900.1 glycoside hydrolase family 78 protein [Streptomyces sp. AS02]